MKEAPVTLERVLGLIDPDRTLALVRELVRIPSANPPGEEAEVARFMAARLAQLGLEVELREVAPGRPNLIATLRGRRERPLFVINGHTDVVEPGEGWTVDPYAATVVDGRLYGRGAADMKGGLGAVMMALEAIVEAGVELAGTVRLVAVVGEEYGSLGTKHLVEEGLEGDFGLVAEPTELKAVVAHKGTLRYELTTRGKAAHGSVPEAGLNAIYSMCDVVVGLRDLVGRLSSRRHPIVGSPTLNVGTIEGGLGTCIVPDRCTITIDRRVVPGEPVAEATAELEGVLGLLATRDPSLRAELKLVNVAEAMEIAADEPVVVALRAAAAEVLGRDAGVHGWTATCDANLMVNVAGIPTVIFGPGSIMGAAHQPDEYVDVAELVAAARIYASTMLRLLAA